MAKKHNLQVGDIVTLSTASQYYPRQYKDGFNGEAEIINIEKDYGGDNYTIKCKDYQNCYGRNDLVFVRSKESELLKKHFTIQEE